MARNPSAWGATRPKEPPRMGAPMACQHVQAFGPTQLVGVACGSSEQDRGCRMVMARSLADKRTSQSAARKRCARRRSISTWGRAHGPSLFAVLFGGGEDPLVPKTHQQARAKPEFLQPALAFFCVGMHQCAASVSGPRKGKWPRPKPPCFWEPAEMALSFCPKV